jgi:hypothetical protein
LQIRSKNEEVGARYLEKNIRSILSKKTTNEEGVSTNTYYYRSKLVKPVATFEINTHIFKQICGYTLISLG